MDNPEWKEYLKQFNLPAIYFNGISSNTNKYCVIVEPRKHELLIPVIKNFMFILQNKGWGLIVCHGTDNEEFIKSGLDGWNNVKFINLNISNFTLKEYNIFMTSPVLWNILKHNGCEYALMFQPDVLLFKDNIDDYINYDYIGAPLTIFSNIIPLAFNGGFSLRNINTMIFITNRFIYNQNVNEDIHFSYLINHVNKFNIPTVDIAKTFSVETIFYNDPVGLHKPHDIFPDKSDLLKLLSKKFTIPSL